MLYKFKSKATGDLIMLEGNGRRVLEIIGKAPDATGIILTSEMPAAIAALQGAIQAEEAQRKALAQAAGLDAEEAAAAAGKDPVALRQRAQPFIAMLERARKADKEIVWGV
jgi:regulator of protease activity HflC (stomatin/prohibitin superfamily)